MDAQEGTPEVAELEVLAILVERYEQEAFPIDPPSALDAILFRMEQAGYQQRDLAQVLGSRSRALEIMRGSVKRLRSEEPTSELPSLMRNWYAVFCLKTKKKQKKARTKHDSNN